MKIRREKVKKCEQIFSNSFFSEIQTPTKIFDFNLNPGDTTRRVNHLLIKNPYSAFKIPDFISKSVSSLIQRCYENAKENKIIDLSERYVYLTYDNSVVEKGHCQRDSGYHIDGMQGSEVVSKVNNCFQYIWLNNLPTVFCNQKFDALRLEPSKHNYFKHFENQVIESKVFSIEKNSVYFVNPYMIHRASVALYRQKRTFIRIYFSHLPITSVKATINPDIVYPFKPHVTTGEIPESLI